MQLWNWRPTLGKTFVFVDIVLILRLSDKRINWIKKNILAEVELSPTRFLFVILSDKKVILHCCFQCRRTYKWFLFGAIESTVVLQSISIDRKTSIKWPVRKNSEFLWIVVFDFGVLFLLIYRYQPRGFSNRASTCATSAKLGSCAFSSCNHSLDSNLLMLTSDKFF